MSHQTKYPADSIPEEEEELIKNAQLKGTKSEMKKASPSPQHPIEATLPQEYIDLETYDFFYIQKWKSYNHVFKAVQAKFARV